MPAGYSGTPLAKKLGIKPDAVLIPLDAPTGWSGLKFVWRKENRPR